MREYELEGNHRKVALRCALWLGCLFICISNVRAEVCSNCFSHSTSLSRSISVRVFTGKAVKMRKIVRIEILFGRWSRLKRQTNSSGKLLWLFFFFLLWPFFFLCYKNMDISFDSFIGVFQTFRQYSSNGNGFPNNIIERRQKTKLCVRVQNP